MADSACLVTWLTGTGSPNERTVWEDRIYIRWNLTQEGSSEDLFNMSDWSL